MTIDATARNNIFKDTSKKYDTYATYTLITQVAAFALAFYAMSIAATPLLLVAGTTALLAGDRTIFYSKLSTEINLLQIMDGADTYNTEAMVAGLINNTYNSTTKKASFLFRWFV